MASYLTFEKDEMTTLRFFADLNTDFYQIKHFITKYEHSTLINIRNIRISTAHFVTAASQSQIENTHFGHWRKRQIQT